MSGEFDHDKINKLIYKDSILSGKIHESLEDPVSQLFYDISDAISPALHRIGITPNQITTLRIMLFISAFLYCFENKMYGMSASMYLAAFFGDCLDGHLARKYNMQTEFGDYYDHFADILTVGISIYYISTSLGEEYKWIIFVVLLLLVMSIIQISCEERYMIMMGVKPYSTTLDPIQCMCSPKIIGDDELEQSMEFSRLFGIGVYHVLISILIWNFGYLDGTYVPKESLEEK